MRKLLTVLFALTVLFVVGGCKASVEAEVEGHTYTFKNNSSYTVIVTPDGQSWNSVTLKPNDQVTFEVFFDDILSFSYETLDPAMSDRVEYAYVNGVYTFVNKQPQYTMTFVNNSVYSVKVTCAGTTKTINAGSSAQITGNSTDYTYVVTGGEVNVVESGNIVTFTTKVPQYTMTFVNNSVYSVKVTCAGTTKTINAGSSAQITGNSTDYTYVVTGGEVNVVENGNTVTFTTKITLITKTFKNESGYNVTVSSGASSKVLKPGDISSFQTENGEYTVTPASGTITTTESSNVVVITTKTAGKSITVTNRVDLNKSGTASNIAFSIHLITWGMPDNLASDVWFTPDTEYSQYYPANNGNMPTMKLKSSSVQQNIVSDENGRYLYFVLTGDNGFEYWRTDSLIKVGTIAGINKSYVFYANSTSVQTDENGNDKSAPSRVILVETTFDGKRSTAREIPVTRIK